MATTQDTTVQTQVYFDASGTVLNVGASGYVKFFDSGTLVFGTGDDITFTFDGTNLVITGLPTSDPSSAGALYANSNVLTLSAGS